MFHPADCQPVNPMRRRSPGKRQVARCFLYRPAILPAESPSASPPVCRGGRLRGVFRTTQQTAPTENPAHPRLRWPGQVVRRFARHQSTSGAVVNAACGSICWPLNWVAAWLNPSAYNFPDPLEVFFNNCLAA